MENLKKPTNLSSNLVPVELDFLVSQGMTTVGKQKFWFSVKFWPGLSEINRISPLKRY